MPGASSLIALALSSFRWPPSDAREKGGDPPHRHVPSDARVICVAENAWGRNRVFLHGRGLGGRLERQAKELDSVLADDSVADNRLDVFEGRVDELP